MIRRDRASSSILAVCRCGARELFGLESQAAAWEADHLERHRELEERDARRRAVAAAAARRRRAE